MKEFTDTIIIKLDTLSTVNFDQPIIVNLVKQPKNIWDWTPIIISLIALGFAIWSGYIQLRRQRKYREKDEEDRLDEKRLDEERRNEERRLDFNERRLKVKPLLNYAITSSKEKLIFDLVNVGLGPVQIKEIKLKYNNKFYDNISNLVNDIVDGKVDDYILQRSDLIDISNGFDIGKDTKENIFKIYFKDNPKLNELRKSLYQMTIIVNYENIYNDKFHPFIINFPEFNS